VNLWVLDGILATTLVVFGLVSTAAGPPTGSRIVTETNDALSVALVLLIALPYYARRHAPLPVFVTSVIGLGLLTGMDYYEGVTPLIVLIGAYTVGAWCPARQVVTGALFFFFALTVVYLSDAPGVDFGVLVQNIAIFAVAFLIGWTMQSRRQRLTAPEQRADALERERDEEARRAVADERLRIAQELHDVVAHSMGVIAVQAGAGAHVIDNDPAEAKRALQNISATSRSTLTEIRRLLGVLREEGDQSAAYTPAPGLDDLGRLADDITQAGVPVDLHVEGERSDVPHGVELTAYRIVQEALTNVLKHAGPATARVMVACEPGVVCVEVVDDGRGVDGRSDGTGHGLLGMRERVAVYGGTLEAGIRSSGGFRVVARLPYGSERPLTSRPSSVEATA
jgi:signal transduction histidine kinase